MAQQETIKFTFREEGSVTERVRGGTGPNCEKLTERIEEKLGVVLYKEPTADMYRSVVEHDHVSVSSQEQHFPGP